MNKLGIYIVYTVVYAAVVAVAVAIAATNSILLASDTSEKILKHKYFIELQQATNENCSNEIKGHTSHKAP